MPRPAATRSMPAPAARCGRRTSLPRCSASRPSGCASCRTTSAAISAPATASLSSSAWCCGRRKSSAVRSNITATRSEAFLSDYQGRDLVTEVELALDADGRFLAMRATNISNVGARCVSLSPLSKGAGLIPGSYAIPAATLRAVAVFTNTMPTNAYRSSGRPEVTFAIERLIDAAAERTRHRPHRAAAQEPGAARRRCRTAMRSACSTTAAATKRTWTGRWSIADWKGFPARRREAKNRGKLLGLGLANYVESSIGAPREQARITVQPQDRRVQPASMSSSARSRPAKAMRRALPRSSPISCTCRPKACASSSATPTSCTPAAARIPAAPCAMPRRCFPRPRSS